MANIERITVDLKIHDIDSFKDLVKALSAWAEEAAQKPIKTAAEAALFDAAVALEDRAADQS